MLKLTILTSIWGAKHTNASQNIQQLLIVYGTLTWMERKKENKKKEQNRKRQKVGKKRNKKEIRKK